MSEQEQKQQTAHESSTRKTTIARRNPEKIERGCQPADLTEDTWDEFTARVAIHKAESRYILDLAPSKAGSLKIKDSHFPPSY